jgi:hypothetical protein
MAEILTHRTIGIDLALKAAIVAQRGRAYYLITGISMMLNSTNRSMGSTVTR